MSGPSFIYALALIPPSAQVLTDDLSRVAEFSVLATKKDGSKVLIALPAVLCSGSHAFVSTVIGNRVKEIFDNFASCAPPREVVDCSCYEKVGMGVVNLDPSLANLTAEATSQREEVTEAVIHDAIKRVTTTLCDRLKHKGYGTFASSHEALGILTEEFHELVAAVQSNQLGNFEHELIDLAVGAIFGVACVEAGAMDWPRR